MAPSQQLSSASSSSANTSDISIGSSKTMKSSASSTTSSSKEGSTTTKTKPSYKHVPHSQKPAHLVAKRNARERRRVQAVNQAFYKLRKCVPIENRNKRVSKVKTLQRAIDYIRKLERILEADEQADQPTGVSPSAASVDHQLKQANNCDTNPAQAKPAAPKRRGRKPAATSKPVALATTQPEPIVSQHYDQAAKYSAAQPFDVYNQPVYFNQYGAAASESVLRESSALNIASYQQQQQYPPESYQATYLAPPPPYDCSVGCDEPQRNQQHFQPASSGGYSAYSFYPPAMEYTASGDYSPTMHDQQQWQKSSANSSGGGAGDNSSTVVCRPVVRSLAVLSSSTPAPTSLSTTTQKAPPTINGCGLQQQVNSGYSAYAPAAHLSAAATTTSRSVASPFAVSSSSTTVAALANDSAAYHLQSSSASAADGIANNSQVTRTSNQQQQQQQPHNGSASNHHQVRHSQQKEQANNLHAADEQQQSSQLQYNQNESQSPFLLLNNQNQHSSGPFIVRQQFEPRPSGDGVIRR